MRIAFYAPLKPPDHPTPSGDRRVARLLMSALERAGHDVEVASRLRTYDGKGDPARQAALRDRGRVEAARLIKRLGGLPRDRRPEVWFTYHLHYKAPDWLGPAVSRALGLAYVVAEASFAAKRAGGPWDLAHRAVGEAVAGADAILCPSRHDMPGLRPLLPDPDRLTHLPPFLDPAPFAAAARRRVSARRRAAAELGLDPGRPWLLAVAMMRPGDKLESYRRLAAALGRVADLDWQLLTVGDGDAAGEVRRALAALGERRVVHAGRRDPDQLPGIYAACDVYVWPAAGEAYGMAMLEAQAAGLPVVAAAVRGVPDVVEDGVGGLLAATEDPADLAVALRSLLTDQALRRRLGRGARDFVSGGRTLDAAARILDETLARAGGNRPR